MTFTFLECNWLVDHETFYADCMYDTCACHSDPSVCACPIISSYAAECARQGNVLNWRQSITECGAKCPAGQVYEQCGDACSRTCDDLQSDNCKLQCVEGCRCPSGQALDEHNKCVPMNRCGCMYKGLKSKSGYKEVRPTTTGLDLW
jgi:von Willebrand factor